MRLWDAIKSWFAPTATPRPRQLRKPCAVCGRVVAHTKGGKAYGHRCPERYKPQEANRG